MIKRKSESVAKAPKAIVAIAASAGGLAHFTEILSGLKPDLGFAFVILQHLNPKHHSRLAEILQRSSRMKLVPVERAVKPRAGRVYVMPSESFLEWGGGALRPRKREPAKADQHPFDLFFETLAEDRAVPRVGVLLSGLNGDGAQGLARLRRAGGLGLVLNPNDTEFSRMPLSAIEHRAADQVLSVPEIVGLVNSLDGERLRDYKKRPTAKADDRPDLSPILDLLYRAEGVDFSGYKPATLSRRIHRNMKTGKHPSLVAYAEHLRKKPAELRHLFEDVTIHVTGFFRDPKYFAIVQNQVLPALLSARAEGEPIRVWVAGCATGQEVYSLAILLLEAVGKRDIPLQIFGTDVSEASIKLARAGVYSKEAILDVPARWRRKYFTRSENGFLARKELRNVCIFARQDLTSDPAFSRMDIISCRNVLIYFGGEAQKRSLATFETALRPGGFLFLGPSESIGPREKNFRALDRKSRIFEKRTEALLPPPAAARRVATKPAAAVFKIPKALRAMQNKFELSARQEREREARPGRRTRPELERELRASRVHFRGLIENQSTLYEELQASHEELLVNNEELLTKNEELETLQEELQAANEELRTVNDEIQNRNEELDDKNQRLEKLTARLREGEEYASAIVETVREPLLILDSRLRVVSANRSFYRIFKVSPALTEGRLLYELGNQQWNIPRLRSLLEEILPHKSVVEDFEVEHEFLRIGRRTMQLNARQITMPSSERQLILLAIEDITLRAQERTDLQVAKAGMQDERDASRAESSELRSEKALRERFVLALSHDLRNPLTGAKLSAQLVLRRLNPEDALRRTVERIVDNMNRADRMITDLLDANRIKAGQGIDLRKQSLDLADFLRGEGENLTPRYGARLVWRGPGETFNVEWDPEAVRRILENLVSNAFKYGLEPEPVTVEARVLPESVEISVHNEGEPIAHEDQQILFEQFSRTSSSRRGGQEGWGLGLTLVRGLAEAHGGGVAVVSAADRGTTFTVSLPR